MMDLLQISHNPGSRKKNRPNLRKDASSSLGYLEVCEDSASGSKKQRWEKYSPYACANGSDVVSQNTQMRGPSRRRRSNMAGDRLGLKLSNLIN